MADETPVATDQPAPAADQPAQEEAKAPETTTEAKAAEVKAEAERKWALKNLKGQAVELTEAELVKLAQKGFGADLTFQQAAAARKRAEQLDALEERIKSGDRKAALEALGLDPYQVAEELVAEKWKQESLPESERELAKSKTENELLAKKLSEYEQKEAKEHELRIAQGTYTAIEAAMDAAGDIPKTPYNVGRYTTYIQKAQEEGLIDVVTWDQLTSLVRDDIHMERMELIKKTSPEELLALLGEEYVSQLRKADVQKLEASRAKNFAKPGGVPPPEEKQPERRWTFDQAMREAAKQVGG